MTEPFTAGQLREFYGEFYANSPTVDFDPFRVPEEFRLLIPYARFWGIADDYSRDALVDAAPDAVRANLRSVVADYDTALDEWLAGSEADDPNPSAAYVAFSAMRMAGYYA